MKERYVGIITNNKKDRYLTFTKQIVHYLYEKGIHIYLEEPLNDPDKDNFSIINEENIKNVEFLIIIGGDGTILKALSQVGKYEKPILGINFGTVGFLANVEKNQWKEYIDKAIDGNYTLDDRMLLDVYDKNGMKLGFALNDTVLFRKNHYGVAEYKVFINDEVFADYLADGVIIAGPTGSTAYNLSSGGPVVNPNCDLFIINPICPHTLNNTSIIVNSKDVVKIKFNPKITSVFIDSFEPEISDNEIIVKKSDMKAHFIRFDDYNFYSLLVNKIKNPIAEGDLDNED
ncbi:NAD(+)/NADH kinase [uncultured Anaerofustis sp.]|uniref:NAD(+)/NADH kinase n=1 Tax=uncultured Anaerofustis sp. TaxID=904996 RepID=UPI0025D89875|nr:NAD(+)/NADH kinase [uncultured Anaerofustis sp.]